MSSFDAEAFMAQTSTEATATKISPFPDGDYIATIEDVTVRAGTVKSGERQGEAWVSLDVKYKLQDLPGQDLESMAEQIGRADRMVTQGYFLELNSTGGIDMSEGKNVRLGRLREAVGQNVSGQPWSPAALKGAGPLVIRVTRDPDKNDPEVIYNRVTRTAPYQGFGGVVAA